MQRAEGRTHQEHVDDLYDTILKTRNQLSLALVVLLSLGFAAEDLADILL